MSEQQNTAKDALQRIRTRCQVEIERAMVQHGGAVAPEALTNVVTMVCAAEVIENLHAIGATLFGPVNLLAQLAVEARREAAETHGKRPIIIPKA